MPRGEWIKNMVEERRENDEVIHDLKKYLQSEKFHTDTTVQVNDVLLRIANYKMKGDN